MGKFLNSLAKTVAAISLVSILFTLTSCGESPLGKWRGWIPVAGSGYIQYTFNEDYSLDYLEHRELPFSERIVTEEVGAGTWSQKGRRVTTSIIWMHYSTNATRTYLNEPEVKEWILAGDAMQYNTTIIERYIPY